MLPEALTDILPELLSEPESETSVYIPRILGSENVVALFIIHMFLLNKINSKLCASSIPT